MIFPKAMNMPMPFRQLQVTPELQPQYDGAAPLGFATILSALLGLPHILNRTPESCSEQVESPLDQVAILRPEKRQPHPEHVGSFLDQEEITCNMRAKYTYQRLKPNEIRLLELQDHPDESRLIRRIFTVDRANCPPYTAISYVWGANQQVPPKQIVCEEPDSHVPVTTNLEGALRSVVHSRASGPSTTSQEDGSSQGMLVWVDAISINQSDVKEKSRQVSMMQEIYQCAEDVHIWLGEADEHTAGAFDLMDTIVWVIQRDPRFTLPLKATAARETRIPPKNRDMREMVALHRYQDAFIALLERPWFTRIWIVQEAAASQKAKVFCGHHSIAWDDLVAAVDGSLYLVIRASDTFGRERMLQIAKTREEYQARIHGVSDSDHRSGMEHLQRILIRHHDASSTIPHDMIYALRGLAGLPTIYEEHQRFVTNLMSSEKELPSMVDWNDMTEQVDYMKSMEEVYTEVASKILSECQTLDLLRACTWPRQANALPSWVPDWSTPGPHHPLDIEPRSERVRFVPYSAATNREKYEPRFYDEDGDATETYDSDIIRYLCLSGFTIGVIKAFHRSDDWPDIGIGLPPHVLIRLLGRGSSSRRLAIAMTEGNKPCIVPIEAQEGDEIGLFQGGKNPLVLRRSTDEIDTTNERNHQVPIRKLIGECFVDGIKDRSTYNTSKYTPFWIS